jgi:hypothetical protein
MEVAANLMPTPKANAPIPGNMRRYVQGMI